MEVRLEIRVNDWDCIVGIRLQDRQLCDARS